MRLSALCPRLCLILLVAVAAPSAVAAQSSGCDSYVAAVQSLQAAQFRFHADLRGLAGADGTGAGAFQFWVKPATAEWILLELGVGNETEGLRGCIKLSGRDYKEYDIGLTPLKE